MGMTISMCFGRKATQQGTQTDCSPWQQRGCSLADGQSWQELCCQKKLWVVKAAGGGRGMLVWLTVLPPSFPCLAHLGLVLDRQIQLELGWELIL